MKRIRLWEKHFSKKLYRKYGFKSGARPLPKCRQLDFSGLRLISKEEIEKFFDKAICSQEKQKEYKCDM